MNKTSAQKRKEKFSLGKFGNHVDDDEDSSRTRYVTIEIKDLDAESKTLHQSATVMDMESFKFSRARSTSRGSVEPPGLQKLARKGTDQDTTSAKAMPNASMRLTILSTEKEKLTSAKTTVTKDSEEAHEFSLSEGEEESPIKSLTKSRGSPNWMKKKSVKNLHANGKILVKGRHHTKKNEIIVEELASEELSSDQMFLPSFVKPENIRDKLQRSRSHSDYDPTSLYIPEAEWPRMKLLMQQYWKVKSCYFDKLVAIRIGRLYWFYFQDAVAVHRVLDSRLNLFKNMTSTFVNENVIFRYIHKIFEQNLAVVLIEQMEESRSEDSLVMNRALNRVLTKGTYNDYEKVSYHPQYLMSLFQENEVIGVTLIETTTHEIQIGDFVEDDQLMTLKSLLNKTRPSEIIYMKGAVSSDILKAIKGLSWKPIVSASRNEKTKPVDEIQGAIKACFEGQQVAFPEFLSELFELHDKSRGLKGKGDFENRKESSLSFYHSLQSFHIATNYLEYLLLSETVIPFAEYKPLETDSEKPDYLRLDGQTLDNLEIFEVDFFSQSTEQNSLFNFMDNTFSAYGKRLFRTWLMYPLANSQQIKERLGAIDDLRLIQPQISEFQGQLNKLPDIERTIHKFYSLISKRRYEAFFHENLPLSKLKEFLKLLGDLKKIEPLLEIFDEHKGGFKSTRLRRLLTISSNEKKLVGKENASVGLFPKVSQHIAELENKIEYYDGLPTPAPGVDEECDRFVNKINDLKAQLDDQLAMYRSKYDNNCICYLHIRQRYEMEFPESLINETNKPEGLVITSKRKGFNRYHTPLTEQLISELEEAEKGFQELLVPFLLKYFKTFFEKHQVWKQMIACLAEIDCLCSLAVLSTKMRNSSKPKMLDQEKSVLRIKALTHPCVAKIVKQFTPNDLIFDKETQVLLITGPNMGGKSTLLRQTCIAIIMAQVGSWVPCESIELTPFDKIFTRIGASDRILEGKSTFYLELEETLTIVKEATPRSFVIMDELGRGTATYDGIALASAVLKYMIEKIGCFLLFTTHYRMLLNGFQGEKALKPCYMDYKSDEKKEEIKFLYKLREGVAPSFGINVARIAGLPKEVLQQAKEKAALMESSKLETISDQNNMRFLISLKWLDKMSLE